jgi:hypothetical protein
MSGLKPGPIRGASATADPYGMTNKEATAAAGDVNANTGVSPFCCAPVAMTAYDEQQQEQTCGLKPYLVCVYETRG